MAWPLNSAGSSRCACMSAMRNPSKTRGPRTRMEAHCADGGGLTTPRSGQMSGHGQRWRGSERLVDDAITLGEAQQRLDVLVARVSVEVERGANRRKSHRSLLVDAERAAEVEVAFDMHRASAQLDTDRRRNSAQGDPGARGERLQQHVTGTKQRPVTTAGRMQTCHRQGASGVDGTADAISERAVSAQRDDRGIRVLAIPVFDRCLYGAQLLAVHGSTVRAVLPKSLGGAVEVVVATGVEHDHRIVCARRGRQELVPLALGDALIP